MGMDVITREEGDFLCKAETFREALEKLPWAYVPAFDVLNTIRDIGNLCREYEQYALKGGSK
jgi:hypothetical protein